MEPGKEEVPVRVVKLRAVEATPESFAPFGQVVSGGPTAPSTAPTTPSSTSAAASQGKATIFPHEIHHGPFKLCHDNRRFYLMRLENQPLKFSSITHHADVTQCLGSIGGQDWYLCVAKPSLVDEASASEQSGQDGRKPVKSRTGHYYLPPDPAEVFAFRVSGLKFLKLNKGTWHAGPLFRANSMDFYNLELSDTNIVDHTTHHFKKHNGVTFVVED